MFCFDFCLVLFWFLFVLSSYIEIFYYEICLESEKMVEKMWETSRKITFSEHNQTLENIFQSIFWNATKHLKIFSFPENPENILHSTKRSLNVHWIPENTCKDLKYYSTILFRERPIFIKPITNKFDVSKIVYHSVFILNIITEEKWGLRPATTKPLLGSTIPYSYHDYIHTWFKFMLHKDATMTRSWFINFDKNFNHNSSFGLFVGGQIWSYH